MKLVQALRRLAFGGLLAAGALMTGGTKAEASHWCSHCHYEWVVSYVPRQVPYTKVVKVVDHYGYPRYVTKTFWRTVQVPVKKYVKVCY